MDHSEEIARMEEDVATIKGRVEFIINALQEEFGDEPVCYALFEILTQELPHTDPTEVGAQHTFIVECLYECIARAFECAKPQGEQ